MTWPFSMFSVGIFLFGCLAIVAGQTSLTPTTEYTFGPYPWGSSRAPVSEEGVWTSWTEWSLDCEYCQNVTTRYRSRICLPPVWKPNCSVEVYKCFGDRYESKPIDCGVTTIADYTTDYTATVSTKKPTTSDTCMCPCECSSSVYSTEPTTEYMEESTPTEETGSTSEYTSETPVSGSTDFTSTYETSPSPDFSSPSSTDFTSESSSTDFTSETPSTGYTSVTSESPTSSDYTSDTSNSPISTDYTSEQPSTGYTSESSSSDITAAPSTGYTSESSSSDITAAPSTGYTSESASSDVTGAPSTGYTSESPSSDFTAESTDFTTDVTDWSTLEPTTEGHTLCCPENGTGIWTNWSAWSGDCSLCPGSTRMRNRLCIPPEPKPGCIIIRDYGCHGSKYETGTKC